MSGKGKSQKERSDTAGKASLSEKAKVKRETEIQQIIWQSKGFIEDEQQWLITDSLHTPAEFASEEDRKKFKSQVKSPPTVKLQG